MDLSFEERFGNVANRCSCDVPVPGKHGGARDRVKPSSSYPFCLATDVAAANSG